MVIGRDKAIIDPLPDASLELLSETGVPTWRSTGELPSFRISIPGGLAAGWYLLEGILLIEAGVKPEPRLDPAYLQGDPESSISLPIPGNSGELKSLILLKHETCGMLFGPGPGPSKFRMGSFLLRRVSRLRALFEMLSPSSTGGWLTSASRVAQYVFSVLQSGVSRSTALLFEEYRKAHSPTAANDYSEWVTKYDTLTAEHIVDLGLRAEIACNGGPLISVLVPAYQTPEIWLRRCIESVLSQAYPRWQLCIVDDASPDSTVERVVEEYASQDKRISFLRREINGHIAAASNTAIELAKGEFLAFLDHDDELRPHALLEVAEAIIQDPCRSLLYSDEDKIDENGRRFDPNFKPDWNADLLLGQNYICHLTVIRKELVNEVGGFRAGYDGSQDHDLVLRCSERLVARQIHHIPRILYHWRAIPGSTALSRDEKDYAASAGLRAVSDQLLRLNASATATDAGHGHFRVSWNVPNPSPKVSIIIPTRDRAGLLRNCVASILDKSSYGSFEVLVVDNGSTEADALTYMDELRRDERVRVLSHDGPFNYSRINNIAISQSDGDLVCLLNNDVEVITPDWLNELAGHASRPGVGAVGAMLYYPDNTIQHAGVILGVHGVAAHTYAGKPRGYPGHCGRLRVTQQLSAVTGACMMVSREKFDLAGGFDEALAVAFNDIDFCLRLQKCGYVNIWTPFAELYHLESASRGSDEIPENNERFKQEIQLMRLRWGDLLDSDPAYNPNLSLGSKYFDLASPPRHALPKRQ